MDRRPGPPSAPSQEAPLPSLRDRDLRWVLGLAVLLLAFSWWRLEGYQLADSVEYMERAQGIVAGERVPSQYAIRSLGYAATLVPFFALAEALDLEDLRPVVACVRLWQIALGLLLVRVVARLGTLVGGRRAGLAAAACTAVNPLFLQYSVSPVSGIAAAVCIGHALEAALRPLDGRRGLRAGLWMGAALTMAYQTIPISGAIVLGLVVRGLARRSGPRRAASAGVAAGLAAGVVGQLVLDRVAYRAWGASLVRYVLENSGSVGYRLLALVPGLEGLALKVYELGQSFHAEGGATADAGAPISEMFPAHWYLSHLTQMFVWPVLVLGAVGALHALARRNGRVLLLVSVVALNVTFLSFKGSKDFRLWLPLLPAIAPVLGLGLAALWERPRPGTIGMVFARAVSIGLLAAAALLGTGALVERNTRKFSGYWEAMDRVSSEAAERHALDPSAPRAKVAAAYDWAVYLRASPDVEMVRFYHIFSHWSGVDERMRARDTRILSELDWFLVHLPMLSARPDLLGVVNELFEVEAMLWDPRDFEDIGPVFVLRRRSGSPDAKTFFERIPTVDPEVYARDHGLGPPLDFFDAEGHRPGRARLLGFDYAPLDGDGHGWITYHWYCVEAFDESYTVVDRLTTFDERNTWQNNHLPAYGAHPTERWTPGEVVRESWPVVAAAEPYDWRGRYRPLGGAYRRGDLVPAMLWVELARFSAEGVRAAKLAPALPGATAALDVDPRALARPPEERPRTSADGLVLVGRLLLPVHPDARLRDDGRTVPD